MGLLKGLRVLEWSRDVSAAACGREFARWGADVSTLETSTQASASFSLPATRGEMSRSDRGGSGQTNSQPPIPRASAGPFVDGVSLLEVSLTQGKRQAPIPTDWSDALTNTDLFITDAPLSELARIGLSADTLERGHPDLVVVHLSPFGSSGPYAEYAADDLTIQALAGFAGTNGHHGREPLAAPAAIIPRAVGVLAAVGGLAALLERMHSNRGQWIELASMEAVSTLIMSLRSEFSGKPIPRVGGPEGWAEVMPTADGYVTLSAWSRETLRNAPIAFDCDPPPAELLEGEGRWADREASLEYIRPLISKRPSAEVFHRLSELGIVMAWHRSASELLQDRQLLALDFFTEVADPHLQPMTGVGRGARVSETPAEWPRMNSFARRDRPGAASGPLDGLRVVDFTHAWLGPFASGLLSDLGAEVVKIEGPKRPDLWRYDAGGAMPVASPNAHLLNVRANFNMANRGKRTVSLALDSEEGRALALKFIARADIVLENFRPRVLNNLRLTHADMRKVNPHITLISWSGFGAGGPDDNYRANGGTTEGNAGWDLLYGYRGEAPLLLGTMQADPIVGAQMAAAALAAAWRAQQDHAGAVRVEGSMFQSAVAYIDEYLLQASLGAAPPERDGNRIPNAVPRECFRCKDSPSGEDEWIAISILNDDMWQALVSMTDGLDRPEWNTLAGRCAELDAVEVALSDYTREWDARTLQERLQAAGVAAGVVHSTLTHLRDPHLAARDWWLHLRHPDTGLRQYQGFPWRLSRTPASCLRPAPRMGEHTLELLRELLDCDERQIEQWLAEGVIADLTDSRKEDDPTPGPISPR